MALGNATCHKSSKTKKELSGPNTSAPIRVLLINESPNNINFNPADPVHLAAEKYTSSCNCVVVLHTLWDSALEIGCQGLTKETEARDIVKEMEMGLKEGKRDNASQCKGTCMHCGKAPFYWKIGKYKQIMLLTMRPMTCQCRCASRQMMHPHKSR